ncbi:hypothetical protein GCM10010932_00330 [Agromyces flavus]|nr:hypothetical protein GCM10010932_00330 [Agromyces flavus]
MVGSGDAGGFRTDQTSTEGRGLRVHTLRPRRTLARSIGLPVLALALPLLVTLGWVLRPLGPVAVAGAVLAATALGALSFAAWIRYQRTEAAVSPHGIVERGFFGRIHSVARRDIAGVLRLETYRGDTLETVKQLFVVDRDGRCVFRMRGTFWDDASMDLVSRILGVDEVVRAEPVTMSELRATDPKLLYWFEGRGLRRR